MTDGSGALVESPTLSLTDLGSSATGAFFSANGDTTSSALTFPVPDGLTPVALNAAIEIPIGLQYASLAVSQNGRTISRLGLPLNDQTPFVIPLSGAEIIDHLLTVTLTATVLPMEGYCWDTQSPIRFVNGSVTFSGAEEVPTTVAAFLPPVLRKLTIAVPPKPSQSESDAVVQLAAAMELRYGAQRPDVEVVPLAATGEPKLGPPLPLERQIIVKEGPTKGLSLQGAPGGMPALLISGPGGELTNQARLLGDVTLKFALSTNTVVTGPLLNRQELLRDNATLGQLNQTGLSSLAQWPEVAIAVSQAQFGRSLGGIRVHVIGSHTPLPNNLGGEVLAMVGDQTLGRWPVDPTGTIDRWVDIPDRLASRVTNLRIAVHTTGEANGQCGNYVPMALRIDDSSQIVAGSAGPSGSLGFASLPQALMPDIQVGISDDAFGDTVRAAQIVAGLQHMTTVPLNTTVKTLKQAIESNKSAILISPGSWPVPTIAEPFSVDQGNVTITGTSSDKKPVTMTLDPMTQFGSLQTVFDGQRALLIATSNNAPQQLDELLRWLSAQPERWFGLDGQAVVSAPGAEPLTVTNPLNGGLSAQQGTTTDSSGGTWGWWLAGGLMVVAAAGGLVFFVASRRRSKAAPLDQ